jgi:predicted enzyme related to lactoylglutathione lyase
MKRVTGLGGLFFRSQNPDKLKNWYRNHLGIDAGQYGHSFKWKSIEDSKIGHTVWSIFDQKTKYFSPSNQEFMMNFRVENLEKLLVLLKEEGVVQVGEMESHDYGKFAWILDPEGRKIELWEPVDEGL